jgi:hypothetical protein
MPKVLTKYCSENLSKTAFGGTKHRQEGKEVDYRPGAAQRVPGS